jgi:battenin
MPMFSSIPRIPVQVHRLYSKFKVATKEKMTIIINSKTKAFWIMGVLNNIPFVIMLAGAKDISEGGTALVFIANTLPGLLCKLSSPYWFDRVSYKNRIKAGSILMTSSFLVVSLFSYLDEKNLLDADDDGLGFCVWMQLLGVALGSAQGSLGEASLLALCGRADSMLKQSTYTRASGNNESEHVGEVEDELILKDTKSISIAAFSSGTGLAGVLGFAYVYICTHILHLSLAAILIVALFFPYAFWKVFVVSLEAYTVDIETSNEMATLALTANDSDDEPQSMPLTRDEFEDDPLAIENTFSVGSSSSFNEGQSNINTSQEYAVTDQMTMFERFRLVLSLWPYMVPLFVVYTAEYSLQSGGVYYDQ